MNHSCEVDCIPLPSKYNANDFVSSGMCWDCTAVCGRSRETIKCENVVLIFSLSYHHPSKHFPIPSESNEEAGPSEKI